jgi:hypothetical protein
MEISFQKVVIWVLLILLAGFIGQFGKSLSVALINKFRKQRNKPFPETKSEKTGLAENEAEKENAFAGKPSLPQDRVQKKLLKARFKMMKKAAKKD